MTSQQSKTIENNWQMRVNVDATLVAIFRISKPNECVIFFQSAKILSHENKGIRSIRLDNLHPYRASAHHSESQIPPRTRNKSDRIRFGHWPSAEIPTTIKSPIKLCSSIGPTLKNLQRESKTLMIQTT